jgi:transcriptional regulator with XRE-family HTH domain
MGDMTFGDKLVFLRRKFKVSQKALAKHIGIHVTNISRYEKNLYTPNHEALMKIAKYFKVSLDYLLFDNIEYREMVDIKDGRLLKKVRELDKLDEKDRDSVLNIIDGMLAKHQMNSALS